jgi:hypothetical protein
LELKENHQKDKSSPKAEAICVGGFAGIRLLQSIPIQLHGKQIGLAQMLLFFSNL